MATSTVPIGIGPPNLLTQVVSAGDSGLDLTGATGVTLSVLDATGGMHTWSASITDATSPSDPGGSTLTWEHDFQTTDCTLVGTYQIRPNILIGGGSVPVPARPLQVTGIFGGNV